MARHFAFVTTRTDHPLDPRGRVKVYGVIPVCVGNLADTDGRFGIRSLFGTSLWRVSKTVPVQFARTTFKHGSVSRWLSLAS